MANFYLNSWKYYEIDFYNSHNAEEIIFFTENNIPLDIYYKENGDQWVRRCSGMVFSIKHMSYYPKLKKYLDKRFNLYVRKIKMEKINGKI